MVEPRLQPIMINNDVAISLLGLDIDRARQLAKYGMKGSEYEGTVQYELAAEIQKKFELLGIVDVRRALLSTGVTIGQLVEIDQSFYFKRSKSKETGLEMIRAWGRLDTDRKVLVEAFIDPSRLVFSSAHGLLSGRNTFYMMGVVVASEVDLVRIRPVFIGWRSFGLSEAEVRLGIKVDTRNVHPSRIDQFAPVNFGRRLTAGQISTMANKPETDVKNALADILAETTVAKDWGGERSDMFTTQARVDGAHVRTAWLLKGRSVKRPMRIADLGKNGDQIDRLFTEPADLYVVQSNQPIASDVRNMLDVYAHDARRPSRYMLLDGADTARVLLHHSLL